MLSRAVWSVSRHCPFLQTAFPFVGNTRQSVPNSKFLAGSRVAGHQPKKHGQADRADQHRKEGPRLKLVLPKIFQVVPSPSSSLSVSPSGCITSFSRAVTPWGAEGKEGPSISGNGRNVLSSSLILASQQACVDGGEKRPWIWVVWRQSSGPRALS